MLHLAPLWLVAVALGETPGSGTSVAQPPVEPAHDAGGSWASAPFASVLEESKDRYFRGETDVARDMLQTLRQRVWGGEEVEWPLVADTLIYLGEIYYLTGDEELAKDAFRYVLERAPDTPISPYYHNLDVVTLFEYVRSQVAVPVERPLPVPEPTPVPGWVLLPLGVPQFAQRRPAAGLAYGGLQIGLGVASVAVQVRLVQVSRDAENGIYPPGLDSSEVVPWFQRQRYLVQAPAAASFYLVWGISALDAALWHKRHPAMAVGVVPTATGAPAIVVGGSF